MDDSASVAALATQPAPGRPWCVNAAGILLALFPWGAFALALAVSPSDSPLWIALRGGDFTSIAIFVAIAAAFGAVGLAMWRRWRGWHFYAGTAAWLLTAITASVMPRLLWQVAWGLPV